MISQCSGCKYCDPKALGQGKPCCTFAFKLEVKDGICFTRREDRQKVKP
jgi:hypothetical protein